MILVLFSFIIPAVELHRIIDPAKNGRLIFVDLYKTLKNRDFSHLYALTRIALPPIIKEIWFLYF